MQRTFWATRWVGSNPLPLCWHWGFVDHAEMKLCRDRDSLRKTGEEVEGFKSYDIHKDGCCKHCQHHP